MSLLRFGVITIFAFAFYLAANADMSAAEVPRFGIFETSLRHTGDYENPYTQLEATATLTRPDGETLTVPLFWDGGDFWRLRISPNAVAGGGGPAGVETQDWIPNPVRLCAWRQQTRAAFAQ